MAIRNIRYQNDDILRKKCKAVKDIDERILTILDDMMDTLHQAKNGAALAANQIGVLRRLIVVDYCGETLKLINPELTSSSGSQECVEGCLSFPYRYVKTLRPQHISLKAMNEHGEMIYLEEEGEMAKCFCHELDHLDGIIFLDHAIEDILP